MKNKILDILLKVGIADAALCDFSTVKDRLISCRAINRLPQNAKTVIICVFPYKIAEEKPENISRYAAVPDYHGIVSEYLQKAAEMLREEYSDNTFECFCDNSPIPEVFAAATAGLGVKGDNGLLITEKYGSWVFLGEIVTDLDVDCENRYRECIHCGRCKQACPRDTYKTDCLSAVSQKKGTLLPNEEKALIQNNIIWGCDICAEVCPMNFSVTIQPLPEFLKDYREKYTLGEDISSRAYAWRTEKVIKRNFELLDK